MMAMIVGEDLRATNIIEKSFEQISNVSRCLSFDLFVGFYWRQNFLLN
jgi:hypothetical protein